MPPLHIGIDIGSTTVKIAIYDNGIPVFEKYERHKFDIESTLIQFIQEAFPIIKDRFITVSALFLFYFSYFLS